MDGDNPENNPPPDPFAGWTQERRDLAVRLDAILQGNMTIDQLVEAGFDVAALQLPRQDDDDGDEPPPDQNARNIATTMGEINDDIGDADGNIEGVLFPYDDTILDMWNAAKIVAGPKLSRRFTKVIPSGCLLYTSPSPRDRG